MTLLLALGLQVSIGRLDLETLASSGAQVFRDMKVQNCFPECTADRIRSVLGPLAQGQASSAAQEAPRRSTPAEQEPPKATESAPQDAPESSKPPISKASSDSAAERPQSDSAAKAAEPGSAEKISVASGQDDARFAPLTGRDAVSGSQRMMPGGKKGYYW